METRLRGVTVHSVEHGSGVPLVVLHGAGVDHRDVQAALEPVLEGTDLRRVYVDLPGMGRTTAESLHGNDDVVAVLAAFVEQVAGEPVLLLGHSYGGYLARGLTAQRPDLVRGLALVCPAAERTGDVPAPVVVRQDADAHDELEPDQRAGFDEYFVVRTRATARRHRDSVVPGMAIQDEAALERVFARWPVDVGTGPVDVPTLLLAGRQDSVVGYADTVDLLGRHPHATLAVVDGAGHALLHERPDVVGGLLADWVDRAR
ncbi:alpha/beta hydrolase [Modestobacter muralis]|uniref:Alpha/beta hydrolase n=1 Tax=Modestobacter muralis TaxID=1608614 RepID=A0A6P0H856_9ACTN|nr:alpha/beta hydrolase [Modestobacter muralis]NEK94208.1 alpha/beta hydrolase [Modestobacter muralis]NEN50976.1 alpha/beta hydrolase [Modestobacter muralis]